MNMFVAKIPREQSFVFDRAIDYDWTPICLLLHIVLMGAVTTGCHRSQQIETKSTDMPQANDIADIDDLKVIRMPHDSLVVPEEDFNKAAMLEALREQNFKPSKSEAPPGLPEWRIILYSRGKEAFSLDLYGPYGELAYDRKNDRYFSWEYWDRFAQELVQSKSDFSARLPAGLKPSSE